MQVGEELSVKDLLYALLIPSANDAAIVLAEHVSDSVESFVSLMNSKALELGCTNTHFVNPNGLHNDNHYSCAYDLALISQYAMKNVTFREIVTTTSCSLPATNKYTVLDRNFTTTNELLLTNSNTRSDNYYYKYAVGIKTGYTIPAKNCISAEADKDGLKLISVILGAEQTSTGLSHKFLDTISLFNYGFDKYTIKKVKDSGNILKQIKVSKATRNTKYLNLVVEDNITVLMKKENSTESLLPEITINENLKAPIYKGEIVGKIAYVIEGEKYSSNLIAGENVKKASVIIKIAYYFLGFVIVLFGIRFYNLNIRRKKKKIK